MTRVMLNITDSMDISMQVTEFILRHKDEFKIHNSHLEVNKYTLDKILTSLKANRLPAHLSRLCGYKVEIIDDLPNWALWLEEDKKSIKLPIYPTINYGYTPADTKLPKKVVINDGATVLIWDDGDKTIVKRAEDDSNDPVKGFLWAYFQKHSGLSKTKANKYLRDIAKENEPTITLHIDNANLGSFIKSIFKED